MRAVKVKVEGDIDVVTAAFMGSPFFGKDQHNTISVTAAADGFGRGPHDRGCVLKESFVSLAQVGHSWFSIGSLDKVVLGELAVIEEGIRVSQERTTWSVSSMRGSYCD